MYLKYELDSSTNFRFTDLDFIACMEYSTDGYLNIEKLYVWSDRRKSLVLASERLTVRFQEKHWKYLYEECMKDYALMVEYWRENRRVA